MLFLSLFITGAAFAQDVMGCVDPQRIMFQHPKFEQIQKQVRDVTNKKQEEAKAAIEKETDDKKKAQIFQNKRTLNWRSKRARSGFMGFLNMPQWAFQ